MLRHLSGITFLPEGTYVIVIEEEIHMGKGERVMKTWNEYSKEARFFSVRFHNKNIFIDFRIMKTTMFLFIFLMMCICIQVIKHISNTNEGVETYKYKNLKYRVHPITHQECMIFSLKMLIQVFAILYSCFKTLKSLRYPPTHEWHKIPLFLHTLIGMIRRVWPPEVFRKFWVPNCQPLWAAQRSPKIFALNFLFRQEEFVGTKMKYPYFK